MLDTKMCKMKLLKRTDKHQDLSLQNSFLKDTECDL